MLKRRLAALMYLLLALTALPVAAQQEPTGARATHSANPLRPLDTSNPRATLTGFLENTDASGRFYRDVYYHSPTLAHLRAMFEARLQTARRVLDLSFVPPATHDRVAVDSSVHLYEVLSRIDLPPADQIPGPEAVSGANPPDRWIVPGTDITLVRITQGERRGDYLFSADTVRFAANSYALVRDLPYRRAVPTGDYVEIRRQIGGVLIPPRAIESLPDWLKVSAFGQVLWKWIALIAVIALFAALLILASRTTSRLQRRSGNQSPMMVSLLRLLMPITIMILAPIGVFATNGVINVNADLGGPLRIGLEATLHIVGAWTAWVACVSIAEMVIASPRVAEGTLDAQVLRLCSRILGLMFAMTLIVIGGEKVGLPLVGLIAGVGVGGLAIALAAQDTLRNVLGSLMIFFDQPYRAGDHIIVIGIEGMVEQIGLRSTKIRQFNGSLTTIPNEKMASVEIVNVSKRPSIRRDIRLGLTYGMSPQKVDRAIAVLHEILDEHAAHWGARPPSVLFDDFAADSLTLVAKTWFHPPEYVDFLNTHDRINLQILKRFGEEGIEFAFPTTTTVLEAGSTPITIQLSSPVPGTAAPQPVAPV
jgi:MscS family membrane protein